MSGQHPIGYSSVHSNSQTGTFSFSDLDRAIIKEKTASFYSSETVSLTFEVLISAKGEVKYVRAPILSPDQKDLRLACTSALYDFAFAPVNPIDGEKWFKAKLVYE